MKGIRGKKIVLAASNSESSEFEQKAWNQMLLAPLPARYTKTFNVNCPRPNQLAPDGQAKYVPHGLRIIESLLLQRFSPEEVSVCCPEPPGLYYLMGPRTFGSALKYPLFRLAHVPEWILRRKLYLNFSGRRQPRWTAPDVVPIPGHHPFRRPLINLSSTGKPPAQDQTFS